MRYDTHDLLVLEIEDALGNKARAGTRAADGTTTNGNNYRVLQPQVMTDRNLNRSQVAFDALGLVVGTAVMGQAEGPVQGDAIHATLQPDLTPEQIEAFVAAPRLPGATPTESQAAPIAHSLLAMQQPHRRRPAPLHAHRPAALGRHHRPRDPCQRSGTRKAIETAHRLQLFRRLWPRIQKKVQAEPGPVIDAAPLSAHAGWAAAGPFQ